MNTKKMMPSGVLVDLRDPQKETIRFSDIVEVLSNLTRHGGCAPASVTILRHIMMGLEIVRNGTTPEERRRAEIEWIMHDLHEAFIGEIVSPMKTTVNAVAGSDVFSQIEGRFDRVLWEIAGVDNPGVMVVPFIDRVCVACEVEYIIGKDREHYGVADIDSWYYWNHLGGSRWSPARATNKEVEMAFLNAAKELIPNLYNWEGKADV